MKKSINYFFIYLLTTGCMNAQEAINVVVEDKILVSPESIVVKVNSLSNQILGKEWMNNLDYITQDSVMEIIQQIENVTKLEDKNPIAAASIKKYLNTDYFEIYGIDSYKKLKKELSHKVPFTIEETKLPNIKDYERELITKLINKSKIEAQSIANELGKKLGKMIEYKEVEYSRTTTNPNTNTKEQNGFAVLKEKFIEFNHDGYPLSDNEEIIISKKIEVTWEIQ